MSANRLIRLSALYVEIRQLRIVRPHAVRERSSYRRHLTVTSEHDACLGEPLTKLLSGHVVPARNKIVVPSGESVNVVAIKNHRTGVSTEPPCEAASEPDALKYPRQCGPHRTEG